MTLRERLGIELPIIQAPMAGVQGHTLALAVSNAGGLGSLPGAMLSPEALHQELAALRAGTDRPFNVNFFCHALPPPDAGREQRWREALAPFYREFGIDAAAVPAGPGVRAVQRSPGRHRRAFPPRGGELPLRAAACRRCWRV